MSLILTRIYVPLLLVLFDITFSQNDQTIKLKSSELNKCVAFTHPHVQRWHSVDESGLPYVDCLDNGEFQLFESNFIDFRISVEMTWIVDFNIVFTDGTPLPICSVRTNNFHVYSGADCELSGILINMTAYAGFRTTSIIYPQANLTIIVTHNEMTVPLHFNINLWKTGDHMPGIDELCTNAIAVCTGEQPLSFRLSIDHATAEAISQIYVDTYLQKLNLHNTSENERSKHYNMTIDNVRKGCVFDVEITGMSKAAMGSMEVLLVEDLTSTCNDYEDVHMEFENNIRAALDVLHASNEEADIKVQQFLTTTTTLTPIPTTSMTSISTSSTLTTWSSTNITLTTSNKGHSQPLYRELHLFVICVFIYFMI